jgi:hypothetical protein
MAELSIVRGLEEPVVVGLESISTAGSSADFLFGAV